MPASDRRRCIGRGCKRWQSEEHVWMFLDYGVRRAIVNLGWVDLIAVVSNRLGRRPGLMEDGARRESELGAEVRRPIGDG